MRAFKHILTNLKTNEVKTLTASPADWADLSIRTFRSEKYNGVFTSDGISQRFTNVGGRFFDHVGYYFISDAYEVDGVEAEIKYERKILEPYTGAYIDDYVGVLDFNPDSGWNYTEDFWEIKSIDSSKSNKFIVRDEIEYNLFNLVSTDDITIPDFSESYKEATYKKVDLWLNSRNNGSAGGAAVKMQQNSIIPFPFIKVNDVYNINEIGSRLTFSDALYPEDVIDFPPDIVIYTNNLTEDSILNEIRISGTFNLLWSIFLQTTWEINVYASFASYDNEGVFQFLNRTLIMSDNGTTATVNESGVISNTVSELAVDDVAVLKGGYVEFAIQIEYIGGGSSNNVLMSDVDIPPSAFPPLPALPKTVITDFNFYEQTEGWEDNQIKGLMVHEAAARLIQLSTSETNTSKLLDAPILGKTDSEFVNYVNNGNLSFEHFTNGFLLRQINDKSLNVSFTDLFNGLSSIEPIGCFYDKQNDYFYIDSISNFYKTDFIDSHLGSVEDDFKTYPYKRAYYNKVIAGYRKTEYEAFNGANEVNTLVDYETDIKTKNKASYQSTIFADTVNIELARRANISKEISKDTKQDNLLFLTSLNTSYITKQGDLSNLVGFKGIEQYLNLRKTPRQNLQRQLIIAESQFFKKLSKYKIKFTKSEKDENISYKDPATNKTVNEFDDVEKIAPVDNVLFYPEVYEFTGLYTYNIRKDIENDPHKIIRFYHRDVEYYGYILEIDGNIFKEIATYKLIRANINR